MTTTKSSKGSINETFLQDNSKNFFSNPKNVLAMNAVTRSDWSKVVVNQKEFQSINHNFSKKLADMKVLDQKQSGRCWIFAALTVLRRAMATKYNLADDFELSQPYLFFWDKLEKCNYFLEMILATRKEEVDSRIVQHILKYSFSDGGQWEMFVNLINKYGVIPKSVYCESVSSSLTRYLNDFLITKLRDFSCELRSESKKNEDELRQLKENMMKDIYRILMIHLGSPPSSFDWTVYDKDNKFLCFPNLTPQSFYKDYIPEDMNNYVSIIHDPRHDYNITLTVEMLGNVIEGKEIFYINSDIENLIQYSKAAIDKDRPVWFGCEVGKDFLKEDGILSDKIFDYEILYNTKPKMTKKDRLIYGESVITHAMVLSGYDQRENSNVLKWKVENSWGATRANKGYEIMTDGWFKQHLYQVVIHKDSLLPEHQALLDKTPLVLPPWDPMGSLAL